MKTFIEKNKEIEKRKRYKFIGVIGTGLCCSAVSMWVSIPLIFGGIYMGWNWLKFRIKNGIKF